MVIIVTMDS